MAIIVHGRSTTKFRLPAEKGLANARTLIIKLLSKRECADWTRRVDATDILQDRAAADAGLTAMLGEIVTGWENIPGDFSPEGLADAFTQPEWYALFTLLPRGMTVEPDELKKSVSPAL
jgi:hypothetical protein